MTDTAAWDRLGAGIRSALPEWARYEGYGTYALAGYVYAVLMAGVTTIVYTQGYRLATVLGVGLGLLAWLWGSYYKGAAKARVTCDHCGDRARGENVCPHCDELTYTGGRQ